MIEVILIIEVGCCWYVPVDGILYAASLLWYSVRENGLVQNGTPPLCEKNR
ncbi:MAG: hypothetical protein CM15mP82_7190 [Methanobacteriota archaeon]|nr:MAG: hypothetical protein CM15mP82_7190 [Euryarchaeota archaeon]